MGCQQEAQPELVTICSTFVLGPVISNRADASILDVKVYDSAMLVANLYDMHAALKPDTSQHQLRFCAQKAPSSSQKVKKPVPEKYCWQSRHLHRSTGRLV